MKRLLAFELVYLAGLFVLLLLNLNHITILPEVVFGQWETINHSYLLLTEFIFLIAVKYLLVLQYGAFYESLREQIQVRSLKKHWPFYVFWHVFALSALFLITDGLFCGIRSGFWGILAVYSLVLATTGWACLMARKNSWIIVSCIVYGGVMILLTSCVQV